MKTLFALLVMALAVHADMLYFDGSPIRTQSEGASVTVFFVDGSVYVVHLTSGEPPACSAPDVTQKRITSSKIGDTLQVGHVIAGEFDSVVIVSAPSQAVSMINYTVSDSAQFIMTSKTTDELFVFRAYNCDPKDSTTWTDTLTVTGGTPGYAGAPFTLQVDVAIATIEIENMTDLDSVTGAVPVGLSLNTTTGAITGTPTTVAGATDYKIIGWRKDYKSDSINVSFTITEEPPETPCDSLDDITQEDSTTTEIMMRLIATCTRDSITRHWALDTAGTIDSVRIEVNSTPGDTIRDTITGLSYSDTVYIRYRDSSWQSNWYVAFTADSVDTIEVPVCLPPVIDSSINTVDAKRDSGQVGDTIYTFGTEFKSTGALMWLATTPQTVVSQLDTNIRWVVSGSAGVHDLIVEDSCGLRDTSTFTVAEGVGAFTFTVKTSNPGTSNDSSFTLPLRTGYTYNFLVNWGDGSDDTTITTAASYTKQYPTPGNYTITITQNVANGFPTLYFANGGDRKKLIDISQWGDNTWTRLEHSFWGCDSLVVSATDTMQASVVTNSEHCFRDAIKSGNAPHILFGSIISTAYMYESSKIVSCPRYDISTATGSNYMFANTMHLKSIDSMGMDNMTTAQYFMSNAAVDTIQGIHAPRLKNATRFASNCSLAVAVKSISMDSVETMNYGFHNCLRVSHYPSLSFPRLRLAEGMLMNNYGINYIKIDNLDSLKNAYRMFYAATSLDSTRLAQPAACTTWQEAFRNCIDLDSAQNLDYSYSQNMSSTWYFCSTMVSFPISRFDSAKTTAMMLRGVMMVSDLPDTLHTASSANFKEMFVEMRSLKKLPYMQTGNGTNFEWFAYNCYTADSIPKYDLSNLELGQYMFGSMTSLRTVDTLVMPNATNLYEIFIDNSLSPTSWSLMLEMFQQTEATSLNINGGNSKYFSSAQPFRDSLTSGKSWTIVDGGVLTQHTLTINAGTGGTTTPSGGTVVDSGAGTAIAATPDVGYTFHQWTTTSGTAWFANAGLASTTCTLKTGDATIQATFNIKTYTIDTTWLGGLESWTIAEGLGPHDSGTIIHMMATVPECYDFAGYQGDFISSFATDSFLIAGNVNIGAAGTMRTHTLDTTISGTPMFVGNGITMRPDTALSFECGTVCTLIQVSGNFQHFYGWTGDTTSADDTLILTMSRDWAVTANWRLAQFSWDTTIIGSGTVTPSPTSQTVDTNTVVMWIATPAPGWTFAGWSGDTTTSADTLIKTITADYNIIATFTALPVPRVDSLVCRVVRHRTQRYAARNGDTLVVHGENIGTIGDSSAVFQNQTGNTRFTIVGWHADGDSVVVIPAPGSPRGYYVSRIRSASEILSPVTGYNFRIVDPVTGTVAP